MRKCVAALVAAVVALTASLASTAAASPSLRLGIFDDGLVLYGEPDLVFPQLARTGSQLIRVNLWWAGPSIRVATRRPRNPADPADSAYNWDTYDRTVRFAIVNGMQPVFSIMGTPPWANAAKGWNVAPTNARDLRLFAAAAQRRYSGTFENADGITLPRVSLWMAWNEPNNPVFLKPQFRRTGRSWTVQSARDYAKICNAVVQGVKQVARSSRVACGVTAPRGNNNPNSGRPSVSPLAFLRAMKLAGARGFDAYAHHPYYGSPAETPTSKPPPGRRGQAPTAITLGNFGVLVTELEPPLREDADLDHGVRLPDEPSRPDLRRHGRQAGPVPERGGGLRAQAPADRPLPLVPASGRGQDRWLAVGPRHVQRQAQGELRRLPSRRLGVGRDVAKGYAEGPAAEEAERRREELEAGEPDAPRRTRLAVEGCTTDDPERHFLGWADDVDPDELFASGAAWGIRVARRPI